MIVHVWKTPFANLDSSTEGHSGSLEQMQVCHVSRSSTTQHQCRPSLNDHCQNRSDLLGTPAGSIGLAHVARGFDGGDELEYDIGDTDDADDAAGDVLDNLVAEEQAAEKNVD